MKKFKNYMIHSNILEIPMSFIYLPTPMNINYMWNFGSMLGVFLMIQVVSGMFLSMHYCPDVDKAFMSVSYIMKDVKSGWIFRLVHMNGASFYFMFMYMHILRNLYYYSFKMNMAWMVGSTIMFMSMATAFLGYVLPWGQMSFWGAMVITNLLSAIPYVGQLVVEWVWGGFSINNSTLNRFYSLHFVLPLIILAMVFLHLMVLHITGSSNPIVSKMGIYKVVFYPYFFIKDSVTIILVLVIFMVVNLQMPYVMGDPDNFKMANPMVTPSHIKPEWYFLFAYSILRSIPNKLGGVIMLFMSIFMLFMIPMMNVNNMKCLKFYPMNKYLYWMFVNTFIMLTWIGGKPIEYPYTTLNIIFTFMYFFYFLFSFLMNNIFDKIMDYNKI
uniref:Cytochrome b n=1 Tax=Lepidotrigona terminata TaxID=398115 RepID=A0A6B9MNY3_9HYME|nr:cytochrome b [Lepidotrigona terminata]